MADVPRAPLYVNRPSKRFTQTDIGRNVAVAIVAAAALVRPLVEPTFYKKKVQQPDIYPNLAVGQSFDSLTSYATSDLKARAWPAVESFPNIAVRQTAQVTTLNASPDPTFRKNRVQIDTYPNIAARVQVVTYNPPPQLQENPTRSRFSQVQLYPNLAVNQPVLQPAASYAEPTIRKTRALQPDIYPNLAASFITPQNYIPAPIDPAIKPAKFFQTDVLPNIAVKQSSAEIPRIPAMIHPTLFVRRFAQVDVYQNIAINYVPPVVGPSVYNPLFIFNVGKMMGR